MSRIAVIGGGIAGTTAAVELARAGNKVTLIEKTDTLGGNIKDYGCKAVDKCIKCNLCLVDETILEAQDSPGIEIIYQGLVNDLSGKPGDYNLSVEKDGDFVEVENIESIVLATGFIKWSDLETGTPEFSDDNGVIWASQLEEFMRRRADHSNPEDILQLGSKPESVAFIQCNGSRSIQEKARYCSKICCGYSYRMARVLKHFYPDLEATIFFIDLQEAGYFLDVNFSELDQAGINYVNCKPIDVSKVDDKLRILYENQQEGKMETLDADLLVLSEGLHPNAVNERWSMLFNMQLDAYGFLYPLVDEEETGIYLAGSIKGPRDIAATISDGKRVAYRLLKQKQLCESGGSVDV